MNRSLSPQESEMVDFLQETITRLMSGDLTGVCLVTTSRDSEDYAWCQKDAREQTRLIGNVGKAWQALTLEGVMEDAGDDDE